MVDAKINREITYTCDECGAILDKCAICDVPWDMEATMKCTSEGHVHNECLE